MKKCNTCHKPKNIQEFYKHPTGKDGHLNICKICHLKKQKQRRSIPEVKKENRERALVYARTTNGRKNRSRANSKYNKKNKDKRIAHNRVLTAIRNKSLVHPRQCICNDCKIKKAEHYHHEDYSPENWLNVIPLCERCHKIHHGLFNPEQV